MIAEDVGLLRAHEGSIRAAISAMSRKVGLLHMTSEDMRAVAIEAVVYKARWGPVDPALMTTIIKRRILDEYRRVRGRKKDRAVEVPSDMRHAKHFDHHGALLWSDFESAMSPYRDWRATEILRMKLSGHSMGEAAESLSISAGRASQIFYEALPFMRSAVRGMGLRR